jgi:hypothetical protein
MPIGVESAAGAIASLFTDPDKINKIYKNDALNAGVNEQAALLSQASRDNQKSLADFNAAMGYYQPAVRQAALSDIGALGGVVSNNLNYDPLATYERLRTGNLKAFGDVAGSIADRGALADRMALAARGYGGRGGGSYEQILRNDRVAKGLSPVLQSIFGGLGSDTGAITSGRNSNFAQILAAIQGRQAIPQQALNFEYSPIAARNSALLGQGSVLNSLADTTNRNFGGFQVEEDKWKTFAKGLGAGVDQAADAYLSMYGGGMMKGAGGGGGGGGGGAYSNPAFDSYVGGTGSRLNSSFSY